MTYILLVIMGVALGAYFGSALSRRSTYDLVFSSIGCCAYVIAALGKYIS